MKGKFHWEHEGFRRGAAVVCLLMVGMTGIALIESEKWWIRIFDFPRLQIAVVLGSALLLFWFMSARGLAQSSIVIIAIASLAWQIWLIIPYTPIWKHQMSSAADCEKQRRIRFFIANVWQDNRDAHSLLEQITLVDPDVILLTELDKQWEGRVSVLKEGYPANIREPLSNSYGIGLFSRLPLKDATIRYLLDPEIPSIFARIILRDGAEFAMWGVHPPPPRPQNDTEGRDAELMLVAKEVAASAVASVVAGDLNDVAWSSTTKLFQRISGLLDPRVGRGLYPTFNARWPLFQWPLDHLFASKDWTLAQFRTLNDIGSDHLPVLVELCHSPLTAVHQMEPTPNPGDGLKLKKQIEDGHKSVREQ